MASNIEYTVTMEASEAIAALDGAAVALGDALDAWLIDSAELVKTTEQAKASQGVTGDLKKSIAIDYDMKARTATIAPQADYALYVELGTRPHMPPVDAITPWAEMHGLNPWAVAMGIKKHGTQPHPFVQPTVEETEPVILSNAEIAVAKVIGG